MDAIIAHELMHFTEGVRKLTNYFKEMVRQNPKRYIEQNRLFNEFHAACKSNLAISNHLLIIF